MSDHLSARRILRIVVAASALALPLIPGGAAGAATAATFDGDPRTTERINEGSPVHAAVAISQARFGDGRDARHAVLSRDDAFADSVAGSGLTAEGPLLFSEPGRLPDATAAELDRLLGAGDTVYVLGGTSAISAGVAKELTDAGYRIVRLAGRTRIGTAIAVADEVRRLYGGDEVLLARWDGWADSITGGAVAANGNIPILITPSDVLHPAVDRWLDADAPSSTTLLGGTAALSDVVAYSVPHARRVSGADRTATAVAIAQQLWDATDRRYVVSPGLAADSWTFGFAAAGLAADEDAPILLVTDAVTSATASAVRTCGSPAVDLLVVGDGGVVDAALREQLDAADGLACGPGGAVVYKTALQKFGECNDLLDWFKEAALERVGPYGLNGFGSYDRAEVLPVAEEADGGADEAGGDAPALDSDTSGQSGTNVQEEGVDEPDTVKVAGDVAYVVAQNELQVVSVDGAPDVIASMDLPENTSSELLLSGDRLLIVSREYQFFLLEDGAASDAAIVGPGATSDVHTILTYVDVSDPADPTVESTLEIEGDYRSARMIGSVARIVVQTDPNALPFTYPADGSAEAEQQAAEANREVVEDTTIEDWLPEYAVDGDDEQPLLSCGAVHEPPLFSGLGTLSVVTVDLTGSIEPTSSAAVVASGETVYASANRLFVTTGRWGWEPDALGSSVTTEIHGFDISSATSTRYVGSGAVEGYVLNQFALSEHEGNLRIATTMEPPWSIEGEQQGVPESAVSVLAEQGGKLVRIGHVDGLGVDERIFAVRYFGDVAAVVTFRQIDPLYLLDLSDPADPKVTGELELPGFSAYLHRIDEDLLLGIGADADEDGVVTGAAATLFDISDVTSPRIVDRMTFDDGYTSVGYDHHAFLHWPATDLVVFPLEEYDEDGPGFQGALGLSVTGDGLDEVGRASHFDDASSESVWPMISRSFVTGGSLYTVSEAGIEQDALADLEEQDFTRF